MYVIKTLIEGLFCIETNSFFDTRGSFTRFYCAKEFEEMGISMPIAQMNSSMTIQKGAVRGMHYQQSPFAEIKLVRCIQGSCYDVAVDLRKDSATYLQYHSEVLSPENNKALYIPEGFAHGFQALEDTTCLIYMVSEFYTPNAEAGLNYADPKINIKWPLEITNISEKDANYPFL